MPIPTLGDVKKIVSRVLGIPIDQLSAETIIPPEHGMMLAVEASGSLNKFIMIPSTKDLTVGKFLNICLKA